LKKLIIREQEDQIWRACKTYSKCSCQVVWVAWEAAEEAEDVEVWVDLVDSLIWKVWEELAKISPSGSAEKA